jgi:nitroreductase
MIKDLILQNRSYRRFNQSYEITTETLKALINLARLSPSARNAQPLKYIISNTEDRNQKIFSLLTWAGALKDWQGPAEGEKPSAYIVMLADTTIAENYFCDHGIAAQSILLGATEKGLGGCIMASIKKQPLREAFHIPSQYEIIQVIALGQPAEQVRIDSVEPAGSTTYWRDDQDIHHVPKRDLDELILDM